ncbi:putative glycosyl transferase [mine drainage metagenome]|uniref:Putative glycosyl transferase n=1 Tax=mine drainage metagenome TaxID=410659 RepID=A0A1J5QTB4_9ZZZZ
MKILLVTQYFWPENFRINDLAVHFQQQGHHVTVLTGIPNYPAGRFFDGYGLFKRTTEQWRGVEIIRAPLIPRGKGSGLRLAINYFSFALFASIYGIVRLGRDFDVIFVHEPSPVTVGIPAIVMKKLTGAPILFWVLDLWPESVSAAGGVTQPWMMGALRRMTRWIYARCDRVLLQSMGFMRHAKEMGVPDERVRYFPSWAEALYRPMAPVAGNKPAMPDGFCIVFAGNVGVAQDFGTILRAAEILKTEPHIKWIIIGDGRMLSWVRNEVRRRGLEQTVHLLGQHPVESMPAYFSHADALLVSLKKEPIFSSTIPGKIQSYLACGKPVIAMLDGEGARIIKEAHAGVACPAEDVDALVQAVLRLSKMDHDDLAAMGHNGRQYYEAHFDREVLFPRLEQWMRELIIEGNSKSA